VAFAEDLLGAGVAGLSLADMRAYLEHVADQRLAQLGLEPLYGSAVTSAGASPYPAAGRHSSPSRSSRAA
jgi:ribonucleotide reductase beta subunit family protein with ferritin-like domain